MTEAASSTGQLPSSTGQLPPSTEQLSARAPRGADLGAPTVLVLVRHGRTTLTEQGRMSGGGGEDPDLSTAGRGDAERVATLITALGTRDSAISDVGRPTAVVCSPLRRARQTAGVVAARLGLTVTADDAWTEIAFGAWDALTYREIADGWPDLLAAWQGSTSVAPPDGESLDDYLARIRAARDTVFAAHPGGVVVVVAHATPVRCVVADALDAGPAALWRTRVGPASVTAVRYWADGGCEVLTVNREP